MTGLPRSFNEPSALNSAEAVWKCLFLFLHQWSLRLATSRIKLTYVLPSWLPKSAKIAKSLKSAAPSFKIRLAHDARTTFIPLDPTRFLLSMNFMQRTQSSLRWTSRKRRAANTLSAPGFLCHSVQGGGCRSNIAAHCQLKVRLPFAKSNWDRKCRNFDLDRSIDFNRWINRSLHVWYILIYNIYTQTVQYNIYSSYRSYAESPTQGGHQASRHPHRATAESPVTPCGLWSGTVGLSRLLQVSSLSTKGNASRDISDHISDQKNWMAEVFFGHGFSVKEVKPRLFWCQLHKQNPSFCPEWHFASGCRRRDLTSSCIRIGSSSSTSSQPIKTIRDLSTRSDRVLPYALGVKIGYSLWNPRCISIFPMKLLGESPDFQTQPH